MTSSSSTGAKSSYHAPTEPMRTGETTQATASARRSSRAIASGDPTGAATTIRAARAAHQPRLVAITGSVGPADRERALRTGFDAHVPKPIDGRTLIRIVAGD